MEIRECDDRREHRRGAVDASKLVYADTEELPNSVIVLLHDTRRGGEWHWCLRDRLATF